mmetsp:Transcript_9718/g.29931  ORF Transcript_9718/g.29931 Transcript_9718/m.29931 type:complete len:83 (+) Transcript_9718:35-283(+)
MEPRLKTLDATAMWCARRFATCMATERCSAAQLGTAPCGANPCLAAPRRIALGPGEARRAAARLGAAPCAAPRRAAQFRTLP